MRARFTALYRPGAACAAIVVACMLGHAAPVSAQDFEITPFGGYRFGGDLFELITGQPLDLDGAAALGVAVDIPVGRGGQIEALFTRQHADVSLPASPPALTVRSRLGVDYWHVGGLHEFDVGRVRPFIVGTLGLTRYAADGDSEIRFGLGGGGGVKLYPFERVGVRLNGQIFATFVDANASLLACSPGICFVGVDADVFWQIEFTAGLIVRFR